jgi:hypothetical protein
MDAVDQEVVDLIRRRLESADRGNVRPLREALRELATENGIILDDDDSVAAIRRGLEQKARGEGRPMREALRELGRESGIELE